MAGFTRSAPVSNALLFLAAVALFTCGLFGGLMHTSSSPKNLRSDGQMQMQQQQQQQQQQEEEVEPNHGLLLPTHIPRPKNSNLKALRSLSNEDNEENGPHDFVWPGNFAYETFHALDEADSVIGDLPDLSALDFAGSFSFSFEYDDDAWAA